MRAVDRALKGEQAVPPSKPPPSVVIIELFAGLLPATLALHQLNVPAITYFSENDNDPLEVAAHHWPEATIR